MSHTRKVLQRLSALGPGPYRIARETGLLQAALERNLKTDWPLKPHQVEVLDRWAKQYFRTEYIEGMRSIARDPQLSGNVGAAHLMDELRADFLDLFGETIDGASPPRKFSPEQALRALARLGLPPSILKQIVEVPETRLEFMQRSIQTLDEDRAPIEAAARDLLRRLYRAAIANDGCHDNDTRRYVSEVIDAYNGLFNDGTSVFDRDDDGEASAQ